MKRNYFFKSILIGLLFLFGTSLSFSQTAGDLLITEFMPDPLNIGDSDGEYFEVYNTTSSAIDVNGWTIEDDGTDSHVISSSVVIPAYGFAVFARTSDFLGDGSIAADYVYGTSIALANGADEIVLTAPSMTEIARVNYNDGDEFGDGVALELENTSIPVSGAYTVSGSGTNVVAATNVLGNGDSGSPGAAGNTLGITIAWTGSSGTDWATSGNWSAGVPTSSTNATIPDVANAPIISGTTGAEVNNLTITEPDGVTINSGGSLIVSGTSSGAVTYTRNLANGSQWYLMASPVVGESYDDTWVTNNGIASGTTFTTNRGVSWYDNTSSTSPAVAGEGGHWRYLQGGNSGSFTTGQGYGIIRSSAGDVSFAGTGINTTSQSVAITQGASNNFNLVGNPFTAYFNLGDFFTDNGGSVITGATVWFWNGSSYDARTSGVHGANEIAPGQGFFVEAAADTNLTFDPTHLTHQGTDSFQRGKTSNRPEINLFISDGTNSRYANVYYIDGTTKGYDVGYDATLFGGESHSLAVYTHLLNDNVGDAYQLQSLPPSDFENMIVPVGVIADAGDYTFTADAFHLPTDYKVFLEDKDTGNFIRLDVAGSEYNATFASAVDGIGRFFLHLTTNALSVGSLDVSNISAYISAKNNLRITGIQQGTTQVRLFSILGKQVINTSFQSNGVDDVTLPNLRQGVYIVQIDSEQGTINKKIVIE